MSFLLPLAILFLLAYFFSLVKVQQAASIPMGSVITATRSGGSGAAWTSPSNCFAFGFYAVDTRFAVGIWFVTTNTVIWTAERDGDLHPEGTKLRLTEDGLQIPRTSGDHPISDINTDNIKLRSASMEDSGNFVIYNVNNQTKWQTFDYPTDTIIAGQLLRAGTKLVSSISATDHSSGRFCAAMQQDGNFVFYPENTPNNYIHAYWATITNGDGFTGMRLAGGNISLIRDSNATHDYTLASSDLLFGRIEPDGFFRVYSTNGSFNTPSLVNGYPREGNKCSVIKGACGSNSYCNYTAAANGDYSPGFEDRGKTECLCLPGFVYADRSKPHMGCHRNFSMEQCDAAAAAAVTKANVSYSIIQLTNVSWSDDSYDYSDVYGEKDCSDLCKRDCNCHAALFADLRCRKQRYPLLYGKQSGGTVAFLKVGSGEPPEMLSPPMPEEVTENVPSTKTLLLIVALASSLIAAFSVAYFFLYINLSDKKKWENMLTGLAGGRAPRSITYRDLVKATQNFSVFLGKGSFSTVFKGEISLGDGGDESLIPIAVKRLEKLSAVNEQGFRTEVKAAGGAHHRNIVRLLGFCHEGTNKWLLIYEYMSRGSLAGLIFAPLDNSPAAGEAKAADKGRPCWKERVCIAMDVARGILYLHEGCGPTIIHGDIKPENVLVAEDGTAKIGDLGLAKLLLPWQTKTYTRARGTGFYTDPKWGQGTDAVNSEVDVYSFGVLMLELITCRKYFQREAVNGCFLLSEWAYKCLNESTLEQLVPDGEEVDMGELKKMVAVALWCVQKPPHRKTMREAVRMLGGKMSVPMPPNHIFYHETERDDEPKVHKRTGLDSVWEGEGSEQQEAQDRRKSMKEVVLMLRGKRHNHSSR